MPDSPIKGADPPPDRPLPDCLTRFLSAPSTAAIEATPGDRSRTERAAPSPLPRNLALRGAIIWAVVYNVVGFALLWWVWSTMRVPAY